MADRICDIAIIGAGTAGLHRWQRGESMSSIGWRFDRQSSLIFLVLSPRRAAFVRRVQAVGPIP